MKSHCRAALALSAAALLAACATTSVQTTSGRDYLDRYGALSDSGLTGEPGAQTGGAAALDADVRRIAAVEPALIFPARIGLARIENGRLTAVPAAEAEIWAGSAETLGGSYGEFVPVSPLIAAMVAPASAPDTRTARAVGDIRRGAARQHLDYVLVYEVTARSGREANALSFTDLSIIGMYVLPTRNVKVSGAANAVLLDVRNGYPYGVTSVFAEDSAVTRAVGASSRTREMKDETLTAVVAKLAPEIEDMMRQLKERASES